MTDIRPGTNTQAQFFAPTNETMLDRLLYSDFQRRTGGELNEKQKERLVKTVKHYMTEIYAKNAGQPIQYLNKEVLTSVVPDFMGYLRRSAGAKETEGEAAAGADIALHSDVNSRFGQLQNERQENRQGAPIAPDFRVDLESDGALNPLSRFEEIKRIREAEAAREAETAAAMAAARQGQGPPNLETAIVSSDSSMGRFVDSDVDFRNGAEAARQRDKLALIMRDAERAANQAAMATNAASRPIFPDARRVLLGDAPTIPSPPRSLGIASANPTLALADSYRDRPVLPQDVLKPQDDIISYKENEHNLFVYSADRDWVNNTAENRYNFSLNFDPANNRPGFGYSPAANIKFKNITRIEFVKAIMPTESYDVLSLYNNTDLNVNIFSFPYLQVRIPELNTNGHGTNDGLNNAFGVISYDAYWASDSNAKNRGYTRMIPKFLKCQKVFYPTPLSTLQKLTFEIQRPDGTLVSTSSDTLTISAILMPPVSATTTNYKGSGAATFEWIWLQTSTYFSKFMVTQGDRIVLKNVSFNSVLQATPGFSDLINYLTSPQGILVSDIGISTGAIDGYIDGANAVGYANSIIIRNSFQDPTIGATTINPWVTTYRNTVTNTFTKAATSTTITPSVGGSISLTLATGLSYTAGMPVFVTGATTANNFTGVIRTYDTATGAIVIGTIANINGTFGSSVVYTVTAGTIPSTGRLINMNHQIQIILRVITRDMDAAAHLRPDNLQA
jgi:hypothetical protein